MKITDSEYFLKNLGYDYVKNVESPLQPTRTNVKFIDIVPELETIGIELAQEYLYEHQLMALNLLREGYNVILKAGTGSGKTESWYLYFHEKAKNGTFKAIAVYPTLALANDQIKRISLYSSSAGISVTKIDALQRDEIIQKIGKYGLRKTLASANLVITNPAFLFHEIKKLLITPTECVLDLRKLSLFVIDEFDFYSPRSIALILAMIKILTKYSDEKPQIVILTATLANPEDMCRYLEDVTNRKCVIVDGKPFRVENRLYIILGKNLENIWNSIKRYSSDVVKRSDVDKDIIEALNDFEIFRKNVYRVLQYLEALGYETPSISIDLKEVLSNYVDDDGVTLVFTKSIARADEITRNLRESIGDVVAAHHHLIPKKDREIIEEKARRDEIKIIVSPRTLSQGIDIGTVVRIVHIGLPESVREFLQREGRKGRRKGIPFSESLIIPSTRWDWELLSKGMNAFERWLQLQLEKTIINPNNKYIHLFTGLAKVLSPWYREKITEEEHRVLKAVKVVKGNGSIDVDKAKWIWERLNFYEFGPPYGIKRYMEEDGRLIPLEPIGHCDLVERFQKGCIDISQDAIVKHVESGKSHRIARAVVETKLSRFSFYSDDAIAEALEEYRYIKSLWREETNILKDIARGKLYSYVLAVVYTPKQGFGEYRKVPNRVIWYLISSKPRISRIGDKHVVSYDRKTVYVPVETVGLYQDYTYGFLIEVDEREDSTLLRLGLAYLMVLLRKLYGIPLETIMYSVGKIGEKKFFEIHEPEAAGLIDSLDWSRIRKDIETYSPEDIDLILLLQLDDIAYADLLSIGIDLNTVRDIAIRIIDYILLRERVAAIFRNKKIIIPKPSRALKIVTLDGIGQIIDEDEAIRRAIVGLSVYDGESTKTVVDLYVMYPFTPPPKSLRDFEVEVEDLVMYNDMKLIVYDKDVAVKELEAIGLKRLARTINDYGYSLREELLKIGINPVSLTTVASELVIEGMEIDLESIDVAKLQKIYMDFIKERGENIKNIPQNIASYIKRYLEAKSKLLYTIHLVAQTMPQYIN